MSALPSKTTQVASQDTDDTRHNGIQVLTTQGEPSCSTESVPTLPIGVPSSGGVSIERLDPSLLLAVSSLFPGDRGQTLVALLLRSAVVRQVEVPGCGYVDAAVIRLPSIEAFARRHGQSKDTVLRYVTILEALGILHRYRHTDHSELHLPLVAWAPSTAALAALDALIEDSRAKLQQLASGVKERFLLLYGSPHAWPSLLDDLQSTLIDIQEHLAKRVSASKRLLLQLRIQNLLARLDRAEGSPFKEGDLGIKLTSPHGCSSAQKGDLEAVSLTHNELSSTQQGDFQAPDPCRIAHQGDLPTKLTSSDGHAPVQKGDLGQAQGGAQISPLAEKGDFHVGTSRTSGDGTIQKGDFAGTQTERSSRHRTEKGDFQAQGPTQTIQKGDFQQGTALPSLNVNVLSLSSNRTAMKSDNDNDAALPTPSSEDRYTRQEARTVGRHLAMFLEKTPEHIGGFVNKCKQCTRTTIRAAVIDMLVHTYFPTIDSGDERGRPQSRGAWFHDACNKYTKPSTHIPAFIEKWLKTDLSWEEIELALQDAATRYAKYMIGESRTADLVRQWLRGELASQALDEALQIDADLECSEPDQGQVGCEHLNSIAFGTRNNLPTWAGPGTAKAWMDEYEAEVLAHQILQEARAHGVTEARAKQEHGVYVVELVWNGFPMTMKNPRAWATHFEKV